MALALLLVDDDEVDREKVRRTLRAAGIDAAITEATTAAEALRCLSRSAFDFVLLDFRLPDGDGVAVVEALRRAGVDTPVVALTGYGDQQTAVAIMKAGAADYLSKDSLSADVLERSIRHAIQVAAGERERRELQARERAALAEAQAANEAKDQFLATLSHELRTPLNAILGWTHLLVERALDGEKAERALETIQRNARLQSKLIDDLLDISRIVTGKLTVERQPVAFDGIVATAIDSHRPAAAAAGIDLKYTAAVPAAPVIGDAARLQQVVTNLLTNALKFTPHGGHVAVSLDLAGDAVRLVIADSGTGIPADFLPHVFDRFRQADSTTARRHGGLGLGLAIVKRLVELHDGRVEAASDGPGRGAAFTVWLPVAAVQIQATPCTAAIHAELNGLSVLVVDDNDDSRALVATILERCGAQVVTAATAGDALRAVATAEIDVILTDIAMPEQDGYSLLERLRVSTPELPAIAVTACVSAEDRTRARDAGFQAHVAKPIDPQELLAAVVAVRRHVV